MIAVDTSAVVAVLLDEEDADQYVGVLKNAPVALMSTATYVELCAVMKNRHGAQALDLVDRFIEAAGIVLEPVSPGQARLASRAYARFGALNFGDAFAYALAKEKNLPLLFKGDDFTRTGVRSCV